MECRTVAVFFVFFVFFAGILWGLGAAQDDDDPMLILETIVDNQYVIFDKFNDMENKLQQLKDDMENKIQQLKDDAKTEMGILKEDMKTELAALKLDQCEEYQQCSRCEQMESFHEVFETGKEEIISSSRNQLTYVLDLLDTDECLEGKHSCSEMASCKDQYVNYTCMCHTGYFGDGFHCQDVDECNETQRCDTNEVCHNTVGSYTCTCVEGYRKTGNICQDVNECSEDEQLCGANAFCVNNLSSYNCFCEEGYKRDGSICTDIDECEEGSNCHERTSCVNTPGSYTCQCLPPYVGDGFNCEKVHCESPSILVEPLGCITFVQERLSWENAQRKCQASGQRLLEEEKAEHLNTLQQHFNPTKEYMNIWVGFRNLAWTSSGEKVPSTGSHWYPGHPTSDAANECGIIALYPSKTGLFTLTCSATYSAFCQSETSN